MSDVEDDNYGPQSPDNENYYSDNEMPEKTWDEVENNNLNSDEDDTNNLNTNNNYYSPNYDDFDDDKIEKNYDKDDNQQLNDSSLNNDDEMVTRDDDILHENKINYKNEKINDDDDDDIILNDDEDEEHDANNDVIENSIRDLNDEKSLNQVQSDNILINDDNNDDDDVNNSLDASNNDSNIKNLHRNSKQKIIDDADDDDDDDVNKIILNDVEKTDDDMHITKSRQNILFNDDDDDDVKSLEDEVEQNNKDIKKAINKIIDDDDDDEIKSLNNDDANDIDKESIRNESDDNENSDNEDGKNNENISSAKRKAIISDDEESEKGSVVGGLIADIFGSSDEDEEFEGFGESDQTAATDKDKKKPGNNDNENNVIPDVSDEDEDAKEAGNREGYVCEFDLMLEQRKAEMRSRRRKRKDVDIINDSDDLIEEMLKNMKEAIEADRLLNEAHKPTINVLKMLPYVKHQLRKVDLHQAFLDAGILTAITEWLAPLPSKALPHLEIRELMLKQLLEFPMISTEGLKMSGLGKAIMYLFKHPRETKANKEMANKLITEWARPIFNQNSDYKNLTREEREQRDYEQLPKKRRISLDSNNTNAKDMEKAMSMDEKVLRPGDPGYIYRARVPAPSNKDYVIRPKWNSEERQRTTSNKKSINKIQKYERAFIERKKALKIQSAVSISIEGRKMAL